jgi:hypothetical protein
MAVLVVVLRCLQHLAQAALDNHHKERLVVQMLVTLHDMAVAGAGDRQLAERLALLQPVEMAALQPHHPLLAQVQFMLRAVVLVSLQVQALL